MMCIQVEKGSSLLKQDLQQTKKVLADKEAELVVLRAQLADKDKKLADNEKELQHTVQKLNEKSQENWFASYHFSLHIQYTRHQHFSTSQ